MDRSRLYRNKARDDIFFVTEKTKDNKEIKKTYEKNFVKRIVF